MFDDAIEAAAAAKRAVDGSEVGSAPMTSRSRFTLIHPSGCTTARRGAPAAAAEPESDVATPSPVRNTVGY